MIKRIPRNQFKARLDALEARLNDKPFSYQQAEQRVTDYCTQHGIDQGDSAALREHVEHNPDASQLMRDYVAAERWLMNELDGLD